MKRYGKKVTTFMLLFVAGFIIASLTITAVTGYENASLNVLVGGFASVEGGILGFLKYFERKNKNE